MEGRKACVQRKAMQCCWVRSRAGSRAVRRCSRWSFGEVEEERCQAQTVLELLHDSLLLGGDSRHLDQAEEEGGEAGVEAGEQ